VFGKPFPLQRLQILTTYGAPFPSTFSGRKVLSPSPSRKTKVYIRPLSRVWDVPINLFRDEKKTKNGDNPLKKEEKKYFKNHLILCPHKFQGIQENFSHKRKSFREF